MNRVQFLVYREYSRSGTTQKYIIYKIINNDIELLTGKKTNKCATNYNINTGAGVNFPECFITEYCEKENIKKYDINYIKFVKNEY